MFFAFFEKKRVVFTKTAKSSWQHTSLDCMGGWGGVESVTQANQTWARRVFVGSSWLASAIQNPISNCDLVLLTFQLKNCILNPFLERSYTPPHWDSTSSKTSRLFVGERFVWYRPIKLELARFLWARVCLFLKGGAVRLIQANQIWARRVFVIRAGWFQRSKIRFRIAMRSYWHFN